MENSNQLAEQMLAVVPPLMQFIRREMRASAGDLTVAQFRILANINHGLVYVGEIAEHIGVSQPAMSRMVGLMEKRGLVQGAVDAKDRRQTKLELTAAGLKLFKQVKKKGSMRMERRLEKLPPEMRLQLARALEQMQILLINQLDDLELVK